MKIWVIEKNNETASLYSKESEKLLNLNSKLTFDRLWQHLIKIWKWFLERISRTKLYFNNAWVWESDACKNKAFGALFANLSKSFYCPCSAQNFSFTQRVLLIGEIDQEIELEKEGSSCPWVLPYYTFTQWWHDMRILKITYYTFLLSSSWEPPAGMINIYQEHHIFWTTITRNEMTK